MTATCQKLTTTCTYHQRKRKMIDWLSNVLLCVTIQYKLGCKFILALHQLLFLGYQIVLLLRSNMYWKYACIIFLYLMPVRISLLSYFCLTFVLSSQLQCQLLLQSNLHCHHVCILPHPYCYFILRYRQYFMPIISQFSSSSWHPSGAWPSTIDMRLLQGHTNWSKLLQHILTKGWIITIKGEESIISSLSCNFGVSRYNFGLFF